MSKLKKRIERLGRAAPGSFGFARVPGQRERTLLLGAVASSASETRSLAKAGLDIIVVRADSAASAAALFEGAPAADTIRGAWLPSLAEPDVVSLKDAADFVISAPATTEAGAVDTERLGHVIEVGPDADDAFLRSLAPLGLDALLVPAGPGPLTLAGQLAYVRLSGLASSSLLVAVESAPSASNLRVFRDSGAAAVLLPASLPASAFEEVGAALSELPPRRTRREGHDIALVPAAAPDAHEHDDEEEDRLV